MILLGRSSSTTSVARSRLSSALRLLALLGACAPGAGEAPTEDGARSSPDDFEPSEARARDAGPPFRFPWRWPFPRRDGGTGRRDAAVPAQDGGAFGDETAGRTLVPHPSWTCGMPDGIPPPELGTPAFDAVFEVAADYDLGATQFGDRHVLAFGEGRFEGESLTAKLLPGSFELPLTLGNGAFETEQVLTLRSADGAAIYMRVCGLAAGPGGLPRVVLDVEAPSAGPHAALNTRKLVGSRHRSQDGKQVTLRVFDVTDIALPALRVPVEEPSGVEEQTWECQTGGGEPGGEVYRETVNLGFWVTVGESKRGLRNIIPITGGTTTGRIVGSVLPLGADYQIFSLRGFDLDARYVLKSNDGEYVIVRNCGFTDKLVPVFEANRAGRYAWLNENRWVSSAPMVGLGTVSLTISERR